MRYRQSPNFMLKNVSGDDVLMARGKTALKVKGVFVFNETCSFLWKNLAEPKTIEELSDIFQAEYGIRQEASFTFGKAITSRMLSAFTRSITRRSRP